MQYLYFFGEGIHLFGGKEDLANCVKVHIFKYPNCIPNLVMCMSGITGKIAYKTEEQYHIDGVDNSGLIPKGTLNLHVFYRCGNPSEIQYLGKSGSLFLTEDLGKETDPKKIMRVLEILQGK
ncbi:MAG: hypothetical protein ABIF10_05065 [Candidatus Woesearchaeota archaeon]